MTATSITNTGAEVSFVLTQEEISKFETASREVEYLLGAAVDIFNLLQSGISLGHFDPQCGGVISMMEMLGRGFSAAAEKEGVAMSQLNGKLRDAKEPEENSNVA